MDDSEALDLLRAKGLSGTQLLRLIQIATEADTGINGTTWWNTALPYAVALATGLIMYNLTGEDDPVDEVPPPPPQLVDEPSQEETEPVVASLRSSRAATIEKNQTNEILKSIADVKQELCELSALVKEIVAPPIIKDFDIFDKSLVKGNAAYPQPPPSSSTTPTISLHQRMQLLDAAMTALQSQASSKEVLTTACNAASMYIGKVKTLPLQTRYRRVFRNNASFQSTLGALEVHEALLTATGFVLKDNGNYFEWSWTLSPETKVTEEANAPRPGEARFIIEQCLELLSKVSRGEEDVRVDWSAVPEEIPEETKEDETTSQKNDMLKFEEILQNTARPAAST